MGIAAYLLPPVCTFRPASATTTNVGMDINYAHTFMHLKVWLSSIGKYIERVRGEYIPWPHERTLGLFTWEPLYWPGYLF